MTKAYPTMHRQILPILLRGRLALLLGALALSWAVGSGVASAREGVYLELGVASQDIGGDLESSPSRGDDVGTGEARLGMPGNGSGLALGGGYGFTELLAFDLQIGLTAHDADYDPGGSGSGVEQSATLRTVVAGIRLNLPAGDLFDVFGRFGLGGYEMVYRDANLRNSDGSTVGDVRLLGRGTALSAGIDMLMGNWGVTLVLTRHEASLSTVDSPNFDGPIQPELDISVNAATVQVVYQLPQ